MTQVVASSFLERAAQFDAAGDHDEAINELARGTKAGDRASTGALGLRLLIGDRAPLLPSEGLRFIDDLCGQGSGEAAARAAGLLALGVNFEPNRALALEWLRKSADAGWEPARRQMLALCDDRELVARVATSTNVTWKSVAVAIDLAGWDRAPPANILSDEPRVSTFPGFIRPEICDFLVSLAPGRLVPAKVYDPVNREDIVAAHRNNTIATFDVHSLEFVHALVQARMSAACGIPARQMEAPSILHYDPGEQIADHFDFVDPKSTPDYAGEIARNGQRIITFIVYLNQGYDGGETAFPRLGFSHKGSTGEGIYFVNALADLTPDLRMLHAGCPTTRGEKWIVTQFIRSRSTR